MKGVKIMIMKLVGFINSLLALFRLRLIVVMKKMKNIGNIETDYNRYMALYMISLIIKEKNLNGNVAELGVYQGDFAKYINRIFPDRTFYLFDTFEGFDERDIAVDISEGLSNGKGNFSNTSVDMVMDKMIQPNKCKIVKGVFPDSLDQLSDSDKMEYCFVSLDADLYKPIYDGLCYFYPRLCEGGYILLHDYNDAQYGSPKKAVQDFAKDHRFAIVPLADTFGTAVIAKV